MLAQCDAHSGKEHGLPHQLPQERQLRQAMAKFKEHSQEQDRIKQLQCTLSGTFGDTYDHYMRLSDQVGPLDITSPEFFPLTLKAGSQQRINIAWDAVLERHGCSLDAIYEWWDTDCIIPLLSGQDSPAQQMVTTPQKPWPSLPRKVRACYALGGLVCFN